MRMRKQSVSLIQGLLFIFCQIVELDKRRNTNREAIRVLTKMDEKFGTVTEYMLGVY